MPFEFQSVADLRKRTFFRVPRREAVDVYLWTASKKYDKDDTARNKSWQVHQFLRQRTKNCALSPSEGVGGKKRRRFQSDVWSQCCLPSRSHPNRHRQNIWTLPYRNQIMEHSICSLISFLWIVFCSALLDKAFYNRWMLTFSKGLLDIPIIWITVGSFQKQCTERKTNVRARTQSWKVRVWYWNSNPIKMEMLTNPGNISNSLSTQPTI